MLQFAASLLVGTRDYIGDAVFTGGGDNSEARMVGANGRVVMDFDGDGSGDLTIFLTGLAMRARRTAAPARRAEDVIEAKKVGGTWVTYGWDRNGR